MFGLHCGVRSRALFCYLVCCGHAQTLSAQTVSAQTLSAHTLRLASGQMHEPSPTCAGTRHSRKYLINTPGGEKAMGIPMH